MKFAFILLVLVGLFGSASLIKLVYEYSAIRAVLLLGNAEFEPIQNLALWMTAGVRIVLVCGAFFFMWEVRHPKTA